MLDGEQISSNEAKSRFGAVLDQIRVSPILTTLVLILVAVVGGGIVYGVMSSQAGSTSANTDFLLMNCDISAGLPPMIAASVKNTGTVGIDNVHIELGDDSIWLGTIAPGQTKSNDNILAATAPATGVSYPVTVIVCYADNSSVTKTFSVIARG